jgi:hypothetical protein
MNGGLGNAARESDVRSSVNRIACQIQELTDELVSFYKRIEGITRPSEPKPTPENAKPERMVLTPLAVEINKQSDRIVQLMDTLRDVLSRIEL